MDQATHCCLKETGPASGLMTWKCYVCDGLSRPVSFACGMDWVFGILRSLRRGVTAHAINMNVEQRLANTVNRWRTEKNSDVPNLCLADVYASDPQSWREEKNSDAPNLYIADVYTRLDILKPTALRYSQAL